MKGIGWLLFPFAVIYDVITSVRNRLYDTGVKPVARFDLPVIGVGNLTVGGTGKSPMVEYLIRLFSADRKVATLSRGYGRSTRGIRIAGKEDSPSTLGDEPYQFYRKFGADVVVAVGEERALAIPYLLDQHPDTGVIILDDAFQHRRVLPSLQLLLTDYSRLFVDDLLLPAGRLRESKRNAARADAVVVTKCPPRLSEDEMMEIETSIRRYTSAPVFFSMIAYRDLVQSTPGAPGVVDHVVLVSGIANPSPLVDYLNHHYRLVRHLRFKDHHVYREKDLQTVCEAALAAGGVVVTTEKDLVKMDLQVFERNHVTVYYLPIETRFLKNGEEFDALVLNHVNAHAA